MRISDWSSDVCSSDLLGAPAMERSEGFDKGEHGLPSLPMEVWNGFVFTSFAADPPPLAPGLAKVDELLRNYRLPEAVTRSGKLISDLPWNWKVMLENVNDPYPDSRLPGPPQTLAQSDLNNQHAAAAGERPRPR